MKWLSWISTLALVCVHFTANGAEVPPDLQEAMRAHPDLERGRELYLACAGCHGADGGGDTRGAVPRIAGQHYRVLLKQLADFRQGRRADFRMGEPADRHHLTRVADLADVALYVAALDRRGPRGQGSGEFAARGAKLYAARCQSCHGVRGAGEDSKFVPRLAGQHYGYLVRQMYDAVDGRRALMSRTHSPRVASLTFPEVRGLADFLSRLDMDPGTAAP